MPNEEYKLKCYMESNPGAPKKNVGVCGMPQGPRMGVYNAYIGQYMWGSGGQTQGIYGYNTCNNGGYRNGGYPGYRNGYPYPYGYITGSVGGNETPRTPRTPGPFPHSHSLQDTTLLVYGGPNSPSTSSIRKSSLEDYSPVGYLSEHNLLKVQGISLQPPPGLSKLPGNTPTPQIPINTHTQGSMYSGGNSLVNFSQGNHSSVSRSDVGNPFEGERGLPFTQVSVQREGNEGGDLHGGTDLISPSPDDEEYEIMMKFTKYGLDELLDGGAGGGDSHAHTHNTNTNITDNINIK